MLGTLAQDDRLRLAERCVERRFDKSQVVYCEGEPADSMLVVTGGRFKVSNFSADGTELLVRFITAGETIGEIGMLSRAPRSATVTAASPSHAVVLPRSVVIELIEQRPALAMALLQQLAEMVRRATDAAADLVFLDLNQRVAKALLTGVHGSSLDIRTTQAELAASIGASRQRVNACLQEFQRHSWITLASKSVRVLDPEALRRLLGS